VTTIVSAAAAANAIITPTADTAIITTSPDTVIGVNAIFLDVSSVVS
jgi:hypothetical protein